MARKFKPGDLVKVRGKFIAPEMQVIKYVPKNDSKLNVVDYDTYLECVWYKNLEQNTNVFHQNKLIKTKETGGLLKIFFTKPHNKFNLVLQG